VKQPKKKSVERFPGLSLKEEERQALAAMRAGRKRLSIRRWRRIRILELLDKGWTMQDTADAAGTFPREVRRVGRRYLQRGLEAALSEDPRPKPPKKFDARSEAAVVALACSPPPPGRSRWSVVLLAKEVARQGIVASVGKETVRRVLTISTQPTGARSAEQCPIRTQKVCQVDDVLATEWAYVPHFYYNFYVYQYATSTVASTSLARVVRDRAHPAAQEVIARSFGKHKTVYKCL